MLYSALCVELLTAEKRGAEVSQRCSYVFGLALCYLVFLALPKFAKYRTTKPQRAQSNTKT